MTEIEPLKRALSDRLAVLTAARARLADAKAGQRAAEAVYTGDDATFQAVEAADAVARRADLDLRRAIAAHDEARAALESAQAEHDRAELAGLLEAIGEPGYHERIAPIASKVLALDAQLARAQRDAAAIVADHNAKHSRAHDLAVKLGVEPPRMPRRSLADVAVLVSELVCRRRRNAGEPVPSEDITQRFARGELPEHLVTSRAPASFGDAVHREGEAEADRFTATTSKKD